MKKLKRAWNATSKKIRFALNLFAIALLIFLLYTFISAPPFTTEIQYRREERANLVGPAEILGMIQQDFSDYDRVLLADDGGGVILYASSTDNLQPPELIYRQKAGKVTILAAPDPTPFDQWDKDRELSIIAFDSFPEAVSAELEITLITDYAGEHFEKTYSLTAQRENQGYFHFRLHTFNRYGLGAEGYAIQVFTLISGYVGRGFMDSAFPATIRLYDEAGALICEESLLIRPVEAEAHARQEAQTP